VGNSLYSESNNSGVAVTGESDTGGRGEIIAGTLEMSNVDLAKEFANMIISQRGFQANSKIISVSDEMLQDLVRLKQ
jgi:flagellar hook protein FlgE